VHEVVVEEAARQSPAFQLEDNKRQHSKVNKAVSVRALSRRVRVENDADIEQT
jgi:hypothetical protein